MIRFLFLLHRYLGIGVGLVMLLWTLSGVVMMYKQYPELSDRQKLQLLQPLQLEGCCVVPLALAQATATFDDASIEMLNSKPVLRLQARRGDSNVFDLTTGMPFGEWNEQQARLLAKDFVERRTHSETPTLIGTVHNDQWTVYGGYNRYRPLYKYALNDAIGTQFYISSQTGEIVQLTTREQRVWGYLGAVVHWLYPTLLRENTALWAQVVIWLSIIGIFLTVTGIYIGLRQFKQRRNGRRSPYRGWAFFHHIAGLVFGVLTLTWVASGLLSMNPWGALEGEGIADERARLTERPLTAQDVTSVLAVLPIASLAADSVRIDVGVMAGKATVISYQQSGERQRLDATTLRASDLSEQQLQNLALRLQPQSVIAEAGMLQIADQYYYEHHEPREFPVYRVVFDDDQRRHYYLSAVSGEIVYKIDGNTRWYRWLFNGFHRGDFSAWLRSRPLWDTLMLLFLVGVCVVTGTGTYLAVKRVNRDIRRMISQVGKREWERDEVKNLEI